MTNKVVLVGGQAVNLWVDEYWNDDLQRLTSSLPLVSGDIDFSGGIAVLPLEEQRLNGQRYRGDAICWGPSCTSARRF